MTVLAAPPPGAVRKPFANYVTPLCHDRSMEFSVAVELLREVFVDVAAESVALASALRSSTRLRAALDARDGELHLLLQQVSSYPEQVIANATKTTVRSAERKMKRAATAAANPSLGAALADGRITGEHVDSFTRAASDLSADERVRLAESGSQLALVGQHSSFEDFEHELKKAVVRVRDDDGTERLQRQRCSTRLRTWTDRDDGMFCLSGRFDPVAGLRMAQQLADAMQTKFAEKTPADCPTEPGPKQDFLRAHALMSLLDGTGGGVGRPEFIAVVDERVKGPDGEPVVDFGEPVDIPRSVIDGMRQGANNFRVVVRDGVVVSAAGRLDLGRTTRLANRAQRRALRALYPSCAIPGCGVRYAFTSIHHVIWWEHHGPTDLANLLPLCERHHHRVHDAGWSLTLQANRQLTIALPDGTTMTTGPPQRCAA